MYVFVESSFFGLLRRKNILVFLSLFIKRRVGVPILRWSFLNVISKVMWSALTICWSATILLRSLIPARAPTNCAHMLYLTTIPTFNRWAGTLLYVMFSFVLIWLFIHLRAGPDIGFILRTESSPVTRFLTYKASIIPRMINFHRFLMPCFYWGKII